MITLGIKNKFKCVALEANELEVFFKAKYISAADIEPSEERDDFLRVLNDVGPAYYDLIFDNPKYQAFVLYHDNDEIVGSAEVATEETHKVAEFQAGHVLSSYRGQKLSKILYQAREKFVRDYTNANKIELFVAKDNIPSQAAAKSNGFSFSHINKNDNLVFIKPL